jgi:hypothetical protein
LGTAGFINPSTPPDLIIISMKEAINTPAVAQQRVITDLPIIGEQ